MPSTRNEVVVSSAALVEGRKLASAAVTTICLVYGEMSIFPQQQPQKLSQIYKAGSHLVMNK